MTSVELNPLFSTLETPQVIMFAPPITMVFDFWLSILAINEDIESNLENCSACMHRTSLDEKLIQIKDSSHDFT